MAYLTFAEIGGASASRSAVCDQPLLDPVPSDDDRLSPLEWSVIGLARKDGRSSLRRPGRVTTAIRALFRQHNPQLADRRLEALRRMAVLAWRDGYTVPSHEVRSFLTAGFTPGQYETMTSRIAAAMAISSRTVSSRRHPPTDAAEPCLI